MKTVYRFREGFRANTLNPEIVAKTLGRLQQDGPLTASRVVEAARPVDSPLHGAFLWDDTEAAHQFRLIQARTLIRAIVVVAEPEQDGEHGQELSLYVHVPSESGEEGRYIRPIEVIADEDAYRRAYAEALRALASAEQRANELRRLAEQQGGNLDAIALAMQGYATVRAALELLRIG